MQYALRPARSSHSTALAHWAPSPLQASFTQARSSSSRSSALSGARHDRRGQGVEAADERADGLLIPLEGNGPVHLDGLTRRNGGRRVVAVARMPLAVEFDQLGACTEAHPKERRPGVGHRRAHGDGVARDLAADCRADLERARLGWRAGLGSSRFGSIGGGSLALFGAAAASTESDQARACDRKRDKERPTPGGQEWRPAFTDLLFGKRVRRFSWGEASEAMPFFSAEPATSYAVPVRDFTAAMTLPPTPPPPARRAPRAAADTDLAR